MSTLYTVVIFENVLFPCNELMSQLYSLIFCWFVQVLIRLIGADETMYSSYADSMQWLDDIKVLEMIVDKFSTSVRTKDCF